MELAFAETQVPLQDYLEGEEISGIKHEYIVGQVYAMSGGTVNYNTVGGNFFRHAANQLAGKSSLEPTKPSISLKSASSSPWPISTATWKPSFSKNSESSATRRWRLPTSDLNESAQPRSRRQQRRDNPPETTGSPKP